MPVPQEPRRIVIQRGQDADAVLQQRIWYNNLPAEDNSAAMVESIMAQNGVNVGLQRPSYASPLSEYILQEELPPRWKVPKFTKFSGDTSESTIKHVARYLIEAGEIARNENLKVKYFPSSLTKIAFTWFISLPANSVLLKARCFTRVPEHELVEMAAGGIDYSIRKKLDTQYLRDMAQLADRVRQVERLRDDKFRANKNKKERVAYVGVCQDDKYDENEPSNFDEQEIDLAELMQGPPYSCKMRIDLNPMQPVEAHYAEPSIVNMVEVEVAPDGNFERVEAVGGFDTNINMVEIADDLTNQNKVEVTEGFDDQKKSETTEGFDKKDNDNIAEDVVDRQGAN
ncbi:uncharacterized protein LOC127080576 [Lathyrus oleraceus]|uniref:uncharacterized protein LOC127080576 n=1 Tax=Pisum sativum TaxID=3888 RepID=UPI0021D17EE0|nr:uncharacterized protein LOC127080576 [Pisum sativum]